MESRLRHLAASNTFSVDRWQYPRGGSEVGAWYMSPKEESGHTIVFVHGTAHDCLFPNLSLFLRFLDRGFNVFAFDWDGHGANETELILGREDYGLRHALAVLLERTSPKSLSLVGYSLGGLFVLDYLSREQLDFPVSQGVILASPLPFSWSFGVLASEARIFWQRDFYRHKQIYGFWGSLPAFGLFKRWKYPIRIHDLGFWLSAWVYPAWINRLVTELDPLHSASLVKTPLMLCYGEWDRLATMEHGRALAARLEKVDFISLPQTTHYGCILSDLMERRVVEYLSSILED